ncbi:MAG: cysteine hydrolase family protein [Eubacteriales bacterium]|nr:cysteine hydrolase family protein [Eubacteriales bacterium]
MIILKAERKELVNTEQAAEQAVKLLSFFRKKGWPVFHVRHLCTQPGAVFFLPDTEGSEFYHKNNPLTKEDVIIKHKPDSFLGTNLKEKLEEKGVEELVICGMMTHMCIDTTVRAAEGYGYSVTLIEDACATRDLEWHGNTIPAEQVQTAYLAAIDGTFARVIKADAWLREER